MNATQRLTGLRMVATLFLIAGSGLGVFAQAPATGQDAGAAKGPKYTQAEYNAEQVGAAEKVPAAVIKCADDFVAKYPNSDLLVYIYPLYYRAYTQLKNPQKVIEYADKLVALGDKAEPGIRYEALYARALSYAGLNIKETDPAAKDLATKAREAALLGLKTLDELKKPDNMSPEDFAKQKQQPAILFNYTAGSAAMTMKDFPAAVASFRAVLALNPDHKLQPGPCLPGHDTPAADGRLLGICPGGNGEGRNRSSVQANQELSSQVAGELPGRNRLRQFDRCRAK